MTAADVIDKYNACLWKFANRAARLFREEPCDWFQSLALAILRDDRQFAADTYPPPLLIEWLAQKLVSHRRVYDRAVKRRASGGLVSLTHDDGDDQASGPAAGNVVDHRAEDPAAVAEQRDLIEYVRRHLDILNRTERAVVCGRFGVGGDEQTVCDVARELGQTPNHVVCTTTAALKKLARAVGAEPGGSRALWLAVRKRGRRRGKAVA